MICSHCKTEVPDGAKYCPRCQNIIGNGNSHLSQPISAKHSETADSSGGSGCFMSQGEERRFAVEELLANEEFADIQEKAKTNPVYKLALTFWAMELDADLFQHFPRSHHRKMCNALNRSAYDRWASELLDVTKRLDSESNSANQPYVQDAKRLIRLWRDAVVDCPRLSDDWNNNSSFREQIEHIVGGSQADDSCRVTLFGHGYSKVWHSVFGTERPYLVMFDVWADQHFVGTLGTNGRMDLAFDKREIEFTINLHAHDPKCCHASISQNLKSSNVFQILPSWGLTSKNRVKLLRLPLYCALYRGDDKGRLCRPYFRRNQQSHEKQP